MRIILNVCAQEDEDSLLLERKLDAPYGRDDFCDEVEDFLEKWLGDRAVVFVEWEEEAE